MSVSAYSQFAITKIYTDFSSFWTSGTVSPSPNNSHNLLAFTWKGTTYSTGVNDAAVTANGIVYSPQEYKAFPTFFSSPSSSGTYIGVGSNYGGAGNVSPVPVENNLTKYLTDGINGLDIGTGIFNFPPSGEIYYDITSINPNSIGDGIPDVVITQIGSISSVKDEYYFSDTTNTIIGNKYIVDFSNVSSVGNADWKFYNIVNPPTYNAGVSSSAARPLRLLAFDWSELGLNVSNISQITKLAQKFSGQSDAAFIAFNTTSLVVKVSVSGTIFNDNNAGVPNGTAYPGATVLLKNSLGITVGTTTSASNGTYVFPNITGGQYTIEITTPPSFYVVGNAAGNTSNSLSVIVGSTALTDQNFGINQPPVAYDNTLQGQKNTPVSVNISTNDVDPNSGNVVPNSINLIAPVGATNIIVTGGLTKGFTISGQGTWAVDNNGVFTFTPVNGFTGNAATVNYTIRDTANLLSNEAKIIISTAEFCYRPSATIGTTLDTNHGITSLGRAGVQNSDQWPMVRKGAWTVLESKSKGFVVNRISTTVKVNDIANPVEGMLVYDEQADCLKIYTSMDGGTTFSWYCLNQQSCPN